MKHIFRFCVVLVMVSFSLSAHAFTVSYDQTTTGIKGAAGQETTIKIKDNKMWMKVSTPQGELITIIDGTAAYQYFPSQNKAYKMMTKGPTNIRNLSDYRGYLQTLNARIASSESVGDYDCDVYEFTDPGTNARARAWVWRAKNFPVKYELDLAGGKVTTMMRNVKVNAKIADSEFTVPNGVEIVEMQRAKSQDKKKANGVKK